MLNPSSPVPLYYQIKTTLLDQILQGRWTDGELLPSESQLAETCQVSRATVRRALAELQREGWVITRKGIGSTVAKPKLEQDLLRFYSLARSFGGGPHRVSSKILRRDETYADSMLAKRLGLETGGLVMVIERLRHVDEEPIMLETSYLPSSLCPGLTELSYLEGLYDLLETTYGIYIARAEEYLQAVTATPDEAALLEIPKDTPVFLVERISFSPQNQPVEFRRSVVRGDRFRYKVELQQN